MADNPTPKDPINRVNPKSAYEQLGASATKAGLHSALDSAGITEQPYFARINQDFAGSPDHSSFVHCDGAGTKSIVAYLYYKATGDRRWFRGLAQDALVMNLDDIFCLGIPERMVLSNQIARNAKLIDDGVIAELIGGYKDLIELLSSRGIEIELSGGETADCGDVVRTLLVDAVIAGRIRTSEIIDPRRIKPGDAIVALGSCGKAEYETFQNSGIGSNGLTLARHTLLNSSAREKFPEVQDPGVDHSLAYRGPYQVTDKPDGLEMTVGEALLSPTRTFAPALLEIYKHLGQDVHGAIHLTGGGLSKVLRFGSGNLYKKSNLFPVPPVFKLIQQHGNIPWREMYQVFNMGQRFELYVPAERADEVIAMAWNYRVDARIIGTVEPLKGPDKKNRVEVSTENGNFDYTL